MKEGTGGDPFGDDPFEEPADEESASDEPLDGDSSDGTTDAASETAEAPNATDPTSATDVEATGGDRTGASGTADSDGASAGDDLPWAVQRSSVKSDRKMVQFYLREFVQERESEFQHAVESETEYDTYLTDVREAAYLVAMDHPEEVAELLDEWGCEYV